MPHLSLVSITPAPAARLWPADVAQAARSAGITRIANGELQVPAQGAPSRFAVAGQGSADLARVVGDPAALPLLQATLRELGDDRPTDVPVPARAPRVVRSAGDGMVITAAFMKCRALDPSERPFSVVAKEMRALTTVEALQGVPDQGLSTFIGCLGGKRDEMGRIATEFERRRDALGDITQLTAFGRIHRDALDAVVKRARSLQRHLVDTLELLAPRLRVIEGTHS